MTDGTVGMGNMQPVRIEVIEKGDVKIHISKLHDLVQNHITNEVKLRELLC